MSLNSWIHFGIRNHWMSLGCIYLLEFTRDLSLVWNERDWTWIPPLWQTYGTRFQGLANSFARSKLFETNHLLMLAFTCGMFGVNILKTIRNVRRPKLTGPIGHHAQRWIDFHFISVAALVVCKELSEYYPTQTKQYTGISGGEMQLMMSLILVLEVGVGIGVKAYQNYVRYYSKKSPKDHQKIM